ncbi:MAG: ABC transporter ATP-binding protein [Anaerolineales bacterium]|nr:ABC transporter ATP-binding protein [Anaerolineales bacterium]
MDAIKVQNLTHDFKDLRALNDVSFSVQQGEVFSFLGPNGAGKTTTIRILTGQLRPTSGRAWVMGYDVVEQRDLVKSSFGVVFEYPNLYERMSARDNLSFYAQLYGVKKERMDDILEMIGLVDRAKESVKKFSNGMKQRLLIGRALLHSPRVLFLDEPTRGLDPHVARDIRAMIANLAKEGVTIFLTTHYMEEADQLSHRVAFINRGQIVAMDAPQQIKQAHSNGKPVTLEDVFIQLTGKELVR